MDDVRLAAWWQARWHSIQLQWRQGLDSAPAHHQTAAIAGSAAAEADIPPSDPTAADCAAFGDARPVPGSVLGPEAHEQLQLQGDLCKFEP